MEIVVSVALVVVGAVIGFFVARHLYKSGASKTSIEQAQNNLKALLSQQAEHHLFESRQALDSIEKQCQVFKQHLDNYEQLLTTEASSEETPVTFYGEHASTYLRNQLKKDANARKSIKSDTQPRDFAAAGSGLFVGHAESDETQVDGTNADK